jgi:peptide/nickel transport system permease protein
MISNEALTGFSHYLLKRSVNMMIVLFAVLVMTIGLLAETMDKILKETVNVNVVTQVNEGNIRFESIQDRQKYIDTQKDLQYKTLGLDEPWYSPTRFFNTLFKVAILDLGNSRFFTTDSGSSSVRDIIIERIPKTLLLFTSSTIVITIIGLLLGAFVANKPGSIWDRMNSALAVFSTSFPTWWIGMLMIFVFAFAYHIFPARSTPLTSPSDPSYILDLLYHMILPFITLILVGFGSWSYIVRYFVKGILSEDYITSKRAMGISKRKVLYSHALKNAAPPIVTIVVLSLASSFGGAITVEAVFDWPGIGKLYYDAIGLSDVPIIIGLTYISTLIFIIAVFIADLLYVFFDPRIKTG